MRPAASAELAPQDSGDSGSSGGEGAEAGAPSGSGAGEGLEEGARRARAAALLGLSVALQRFCWEGARLGPAYEWRGYSMLAAERVPEVHHAMRWSLQVVVLLACMLRVKGATPGDRDCWVWTRLATTGARCIILHARARPRERARAPA